MNVTLISRFFDTRNRGIGSFSKLIYDSLDLKCINLKKISQDDTLLPVSWPLSYFSYYSIDLKRILKKNKYKDSDIFHCLNPLESLYLPKNKSISTILDFIPLNNNTNDKLYTKFFRKGINSSIQCEKIIVLNSDLERILNSEYNVEKSSIEVIPPAIDHKYFALNEKHEKYTIGTVSSLDKRKRIELLIKSFLKADIENSELLIGGGGGELENLKKIAKNDNRIKFLGFVPDEKMNEFYNKLDVFVFPTIAEGYGMPIVEAMACGKPVITLTDADIPSNLKEKTFICQKDNLSNILLNRDYSCNIKQNIEFAKEHSIENIGEKLIKVYESVI